MILLLYELVVLSACCIVRYWRFCEMCNSSLEIKHFLVVISTEWYFSIMYCPSSLICISKILFSIFFSKQRFYALFNTLQALCNLCDL